MGQLLKIATVDDLQPERELLLEALKNYMEHRWLKYELFQYESGEEFVSALEKERFDIVFMDIFMGEMNGITCAEKLRERDMDCKLVFITNTDEFLRVGYAYNPCHYLIKPFDVNEFEKAMENCRIERQFDVPFLDVVSEREPLRLHTSQIAYIASVDKSTMVHLESRVYTVWESFGKIAKPLLADRRFIQCIRGVLVNMDFIATVEENDFLMKDGTRLPMTVRERKNLITQYRAYQFERASSWGRNDL